MNPQLMARGRLLEPERFLRRYGNVTTTDMNNQRMGGQVAFSDSAAASFTACTWAHNSTISPLVKPVV
jgi:hypothetical protein